MKFPAALQAPESFAGLDEAPTGMNGKIGILERGKVGTWSLSQGKEALARTIRLDITCFYLAQSDATVPVKR